MSTKPVVETLYDRVHTAAAAVKHRVPIAPKVGLILGSGLGGYGDKLENATAIPYSARASRCPCSGRVRPSAP